MQVIGVEPNLETDEINSSTQDRVTLQIMKMCYFKKRG